jgi:hypothetical protein
MVVQGEGNTPSVPAAPATDVARIAEAETSPVGATTSDPDMLVESQHVVEAGLEARGFTEVQRVTLRDTLPKLALEDRLAVMNQLGAALNRGEIEFDAREVF